MPVTTFKFDEQYDALFLKLVISTRSASKAEVLRKALTLLDIATDAQARGDKMVFKNDATGKETEIVLV